VRTALFRLLAAFLGLGAAAIAPLVYSGGAAGAELGASLYPDLMEFDEAFKLYERGELERARNGFRHLAELGDPEARLNLGVMLAKGEGGDADLVEAVAWIRWAADQGSDGAAQVLSVLERSLDDTHRERAATRLAEQSLPRETETAPACSGRTHEMRCDCLCARMERTPPVYPRKALEKGQTGFAVVYYLVSPEGNIAAPYEMPGARRDDLFGPAALRAVRQWDARACTGDDYFATLQTIVFVFETDDEPGAFQSMERERAARQLAKARAGDPGEAYDMRADPSLAEMHAMALAENGRFREAVTWQKRAITVSRKLPRELSGAIARLAAYEAGEPWRDPRLAMAVEDEP
jgi:TPR repeat protein